MEKVGKIHGDLSSEVMNLYSRKEYMVFTHPELGYDYWATDILPMVKKTMLFGLIATIVPDFNHSIASLIRNNKEDAYEIHVLVRFIVSNKKEDDWFSLLPSPSPH